MRLDRIKVITEIAKKDLRRNDLATKAGINPGTVSAVCNGRSCSDSTAMKIATALGVTVEELKA